MKKLLALFLALLTMFSMTACTVGGDSDDDDALYTLNVGFYQGGLASQYMDEIIKLYKVKNPDVKIKLKPGKSEYTDGSLLSTISSNGLDLYVLDSNTYETFYSSPTNSFRIGVKISNKIPFSRHTQPCSTEFLFNILSPALTTFFIPSISNSNAPETT